MEAHLTSEFGAKGLLFHHFIFEKYFFVVFCCLFGDKNDLLSDKYRPLFAENVLQCSTCPGLIHYLSDFIVGNSGGSELPSGAKGWSDKGSVSSLSIGWQSFGEEGGWPNQGHSAKKIAALWSGPPGNGKKSTLRSFLRSLETQVETINVITYKSLKEVAIKFAKAVFSQDVIASIKRAFNLCENFSESLSLYQNISRDNPFHARHSRALDLPSDIPLAFDARSRKSAFRASKKPELVREGPKGLRVFVVENVHRILAEETPKNARTKLNQFLKFIKSSRHPFIFVHDSTADAYFSSLPTHFLSFRSPQPDPLEIAALVYLILAVEKNFGVMIPKVCRDDGSPVAEIVEAVLSSIDQLQIKTPVFPSLGRLMYLINRFDYNLHRIFSHLQQHQDYGFQAAIPIPFLIQTPDPYFQWGGKWLFNTEVVVTLAQKRYPRHCLAEFKQSRRDVRAVLRSRLVEIDEKLESDQRFGPAGTVWESSRRFSDLAFRGTPWEQERRSLGDARTVVLEDYGRSLESLVLLDRLNGDARPPSHSNEDCAQLWRVIGFFGRSVE
jgi:hypothetical protein